MSDLPSIDQPENLDHDDVEGHVLRAGKLTTDDQSAPAAEDTPDEDDTEGHAVRGKAFLPADEDDTEGHAARAKF